MRLSHISLSLGILGSFLAPSLALASFTDVSKNNPHYDAILYVQEQGIVQGYDDGTFRSTATINRAEFIKILIAANFDESRIDACTETYFNDDDDQSAWFSKYTCTAKEEGIIEGYADHTFRPAANINFAEAAKVIVKTFELPLVNEGDGPWYRPFVETLAARNAIPMSVGHFNQTLTRGEMAEIIYRIHLNVTTKQSRTFGTLR